jgi:hypothetical protein
VAGTAISAAREARDRLEEMYLEILGAFFAREFHVTDAARTELFARAHQAYG